MDAAAKILHISNMNQRVPDYALYGEATALPDLLHVEALGARAALHDWVIRPHRHGWLHQIFLITSGAGVLTLEGRDIPLHLPVLLNVPPGVVHGLRMARGTLGHVVTLPVPLTERLLHGMPLLSARLAEPLVLAADATLPPLIAQLEQAHRSPEGPLPGTRALLLSGLAAQLLATVAGMGGASGSDLFQRFQTLVEAQWRAAWPVERYAAALGISPTHLGRICRAASGQGPLRLITMRRMREACRLLAYTRMSVAEVGYALGFDDPAYFTRSFGRAMGETPRDYRRRVGG